MSRRRGWAVIAVVAALGLAACGSSGNGTKAAGSGKAIGDDGIRVADVVATTDATRQPVDATPSPDGKTIYFAATGDPTPAIFSVPAAGGTVTKITEGAPLTKPSGIAAMADGNGLYVADQQAGNAGTPGFGGGILTVPTTGSPTFLAGTAGRAPHGLDVVKQGGSDVIYFTGTDPTNGAAGLFQVPAAGGTVTTVAEGAPFVAPDSVVVDTKGVAYVSDQGSGTGQGQVFSVKGGKVAPVLTGQTLGAPAGVTLVGDDGTLLVSSIDATSRSDQVLFVDLATGKTAAATKALGANKNSSGGLHRALNAPLLAWCDVSRSGKIYRIEP